MQITIYHNPDCGTSRNALAAIRAAGLEPRIIEYLKTPPSREELKDLIARMNLTAREVVRKREPLFHELRLDERDVGEDELIDGMIENPILMRLGDRRYRSGCAALPPKRNRKGVIGHGSALAVTVDRTFLLSRIYAEGWNAAIHLPATECDDLNLWKIGVMPFAACVGR